MNPNYGGITGHNAQSQKRPVAWFERRNPPVEKKEPLSGNHHDLTGGKFAAILAESMTNKGPE